MRRSLFTLAVLATCTLLPSPAGAAAGLAPGQTGNGRQLDPVGRMTTLGAFPTGGALTPDGRFYWAVDAGRGPNSVRVIDVASGQVRQTLSIPGGFVGIVFAADGRRAYVSGAPADRESPKGDPGQGGEVIHVFDVDPGSGTASEQAPIMITGARDGAAAGDTLPPAQGVNAWPEGMDISADGKLLVVALNQADQVAIVELATRTVRLAPVGRYPYGVVTDPRRSRAYVTNERDGTVTVLDLPSGNTVTTIGVGNTRNDYAHPEGLVADPVRDRLYVAVTDRDLVAVIDTATLRVERYLQAGRENTPIGTAPVAPAVSPDGATLYIANAGEDAVQAIALADRPATEQAGRLTRQVVRSRSIRQIGRYRTARDRAQRLRTRELRAARTARSRASTPAGRRAADRRADRARRTFTRRLAVLRRGFLYGYARTLCAGPSAADDRRYARAVLSAYASRDRDVRAAGRARSGRSDTAGVRRASAARVRAARRAFTRRTLAARKALVPRALCPRAGFLPGLKAFETIGRMPTAAYPTDVEVSADGKTLVWLSAKGLGTGPNNQGITNISRRIQGSAGVLDQPTDREFAAFSTRADRALVPTNQTGPPPNTPVHSPAFGPSGQIKHVFYVVRENRTYDQIFGSETRGTGAPSLQLFDDNGVPGPTGGVTPNAHALARRFSLLDNVYANTEESTAGHKIAAGAYANDYLQKREQSGRKNAGDPDIFPIGIPPNAFVFDQAVRQGLSFRIYGEGGAGNQPFADDGRPTFGAVLAGTDPAYPNQVFGTCRGTAAGIVPGTPNAVRCTADSGDVGTTHSAPAVNSRIRAFQAEFGAQIAAGTVPSFNYFSLFNDHTDGTTPGVYTPKANMADNDLALGQLVELVSQSPIWKDSAIIVQEDDSQDGIDSVDAHRIPALVISPWARRGGAAISTRYDQYSLLRTASLMLGLRPLSLNDALATPLYDAFISGDEQPDVEGTRYRAIQPEQSLTEVNPASAPNARLSAALPWDKADAVPQRLADRILWQSVFGAGSTPPLPGPNASPTERARATGALRRFKAGLSTRTFLTGSEEGPGRRARAALTANLLAFGSGLTLAQAERRLELMEGDDEEEEDDDDG